MIAGLGMMFKAIEGIVEAAPQLVLQLYIIARNGIGSENEKITDMIMGGEYEIYS